MKTKSVEKSLDKITRKGETGYFVPDAIFRKDNCIIIVNSSSENQHTVHEIISKGDNIHIYSAKRPKSTNPSKRILLKTVRNKSSLFRSLNHSLTEIITHRTKGTRPKTFEEFLDEL